MVRVETLIGLLLTVDSCGGGDSELSSRTGEEPFGILTVDGEEEEEEYQKEWRENNYMGEKEIFHPVIRSANIRPPIELKFGEGVHDSRL
ncbi:hypothetical protein FNV43_RR01374 [Rhamnella rubrinervis]|uniref:Uncharacterized protein n=1 Tax=Rhamnella rubrinervis TaxID=2594499 RepID=A0A8K0HS60_9ROSA|nr:hypothetical protein FNV43_RR01374 [Rhamnella rubrinervis]